MRGRNQRGSSASAPGASRELFPLRASPSSGTVPAAALRRPRLPAPLPSGSARHLPSLIGTFAARQRAVKKIPRSLQPPPPALRFPPGAGPRHGAVRVPEAGGERAWGGLGREESAAAERRRLRGGGGPTRWRRWASSECRQGRGGRAPPGRAGPGAALGEELGPALRAGASAGKLLPRDSLVPGVRRAASLCWPDFKTVFIKNKQNSSSGQALEGAGVLPGGVFHSYGGKISSIFPHNSHPRAQPGLLLGLRGRVRGS